MDFTNDPGEPGDIDRLYPERRVVLLEARWGDVAVGIVAAMEPRPGVSEQTGAFVRVFAGSRAIAGRNRTDFHG